MEKENENGFKNNYANHSKDSKWQNIQRTIYDPSRNEFLGRTPSNWGKLVIFYVIFYAVLAALFAICMQGLLATIDNDEPKWTQGESLIGNNPGLGFRPLSDRTEEGALIWYNDRNATSGQKWVDLIETFLKPYHEDTTGKNMVPCDYDMKPNNGSVCFVNTTTFGHCSPSNGYGYFSASPCVFLKLNRIWGWEPEYYTEPIDEMPDDLKTKINGTPEKERSKIWISCDGMGPSDRENIQKLEYFPHQGFPGYFYPFRNSRNYLSPLVAVRIVDPTPNIIVTIECRAWAKNIEYIGGDQYREGSVTFDVMVDSKDTPN